MKSNGPGPERARSSGEQRGSSAVVSVDGWIGPPEEASVRPLDRGFLYGEAVYENLRTYGGEPFLEGRHLGRLRRSAAYLGIPLRLSDAEIGERLRAALSAAGGGEDGEHSLRLILTAGPEGGVPSLVILVRPLPPLPVDPEREGVGVLLFDRVRTAPVGLPADVKTTNLLGGRLAVREAHAAGAHEAVFRSPGGGLAEGATSNLFLVHDGVVRTAPASAGLLPGITRSLVFEVLDELGIPCEEARLPTTRLEDADEAFLTSSSREVLPVTWVAAPGSRRQDIGDSRRIIGNGKPGALTLRALAGYRQTARRLLGAPELG